MSVEGTCPVCDMTGRLRADGKVRLHKDKRGSKRRYERTDCAGSGQQPRADR